MIVLGDGVVAQVVLSDNAKGQYLSISFGWCFAVMCAIYIAGGISVSYALKLFDIST
jgi:aquaglyceroporin related protein, other eukaryote